MSSYGAVVLPLPVAGGGLLRVVQCLALAVG